MMHYTFFLFGLCFAADESTTTAAPPVQEPDCHGCSSFCHAWDACHGCKTCLEGFTLKFVTQYSMQVGTCVPECICPGGTPFKFCTEVNETKCRSCDDAHYLDKTTNTCLPRECTCNGGMGAEGAECKLNRKREPREQCTACDWPYILDADTLLCKKPNLTKCELDEECLSGDCSLSQGQTKKRCQCQTGCAYTKGTAVDATNVHSQEECVTHC